MSRKSRFSAAGALAVVLAVPSARAEQPAPVESPARSVEAPSPAQDDPQTSEAREAFRLGAARAREARWDEARVMFVRSNQVKAHPVTIYNIAFCDRAMGRPARALELFQRTLDAHAQGPDHLPDELVPVTRRYLAEASARVARVRLIGLDAAKLRVDGHALEAFRSGEQTLYTPAESTEQAPASLPSQAVVLLDPGTHVFVASRPGSADLVRTRAVAAGEELSVDFDFEPTPVAPERRAQPAPPAQKSSPVPRSHAFIDRRYGYVALGVGALGAVVGGISGGIALSERAKLRADCGPAHDNCPRDDASSVDKLRSMSTVSTVAFAIAGVGLASGVGLLLLAPEAPTPKRHARLELKLGLGQLGVAGELP